MIRISAMVIVGCILLASQTACGGANNAACGRVRSEAFDRRSLIHVLPGGNAPKYLTDPPTSGPHQPSPPIERFSSSPIPRPVQVGLLEAGSVMFQYNGLSDSEQASLLQLASPNLVIAPNRDLPAGDKVVATAWLTKQECQDLDPAALRSFQAKHANKGPGSDG